MSNEDFLELVINKVLTGGNRTKAENLRDVFDEIPDSYQNLDGKDQPDGYLGIDTNGDSVIPNKLTYKNSYSVTSEPSHVLGSGAGTGATASVTGNNECGTIALSTGTSTVAGGTVITLTLSGSFSFPNKAVCILYPANDEAVGLGMLITMGGGGTIVISAATLVALNDSTNYIFNYIIKGY